MQTLFIGGCPFCGNLDCIAGQCRSVEVEEVFPLYPSDVEFTEASNLADWKELISWWESDNKDWWTLQDIVSRMLEVNK